MPEVYSASQWSGIVNLKTFIMDNPVIMSCLKHKIPLKHQMCASVSFTENFNMPIVSPYTGIVPDQILSFNRVRCSKNRNYTAHFYIFDQLFECVWNNPEKYLHLLKSLNSVISTDFSLFSDMLMPEIMWNTFRNKLIAAWWQKKGISVIPNVSWGNHRSLEMCLEGYPQKSIIAINSTGLHCDKQAKKMWIEGYNKVVETLSPIHIMRYGAKQDGELETISTYYNNDNFNSSNNGR